MDEVEELIEQLKSEDVQTRRDAADRLGEIKDKRAVPALIEVWKDEDVGVRNQATWALVYIVEKCETIEDFEKVEKGIDEGSVLLRKGRPDKTMLINVQIHVARLTREITKKKDKLAPKRDLLLGDKPKPPKKGRGVYQITRMIRNG